MSLLALIREESIAVNARLAGDAYEYLTDEILRDARLGAECGVYSVTNYSHDKRQDALLALQLQGFDARFENESHGSISVSWLPRHPR